VRVIIDSHGAFASRGITLVQGGVRVAPIRVMAVRGRVLSDRRIVDISNKNIELHAF
jgi:hypothetical protein